MSGKKSKKKWFFIGGGVTIILAIFVIANVARNGGSEYTVQTKKAEKADVISVVSGSGRVEPKTKLNITSEVNAEVIGLPVKEGDVVKKGQILIQLDTVQLQKDMESAQFAANETEARVEGSQVLLDQYEEEYNRQKELFQKKLTSDKAYKDAMYAFNSQKASHKALVEQLKAAESRLDKAQDNLSKTTIKSPMDGIVTLIDVEVGEIAQAQTPYSAGRTLMVVSDLSSFEVEVEIDETDITDLELAQKASVEIDAFPDTTFKGRVTEIGNTAVTSGMGSNDQATNFMVKVALLDASPKVRPGMSSTVDITTDEHFDVVTIPIQALVMRDAKDTITTVPEKKVDVESNVAMASPSEGEKVKNEDGGEKAEEIEGVFVNRDGVVKFVPVKVGLADQQNYEVLGGLEEGDEVVIGSFSTLRKLKSGDKVRVNNQFLKEGSQQ